MKVTRDITASGLAMKKGSLGMSRSETTQRIGIKVFYYPNTSDCSYIDWQHIRVPNSTRTHFEDLEMCHHPLSHSKLLLLVSLPWTSVDHAPTIPKKAPANAFHHHSSHGHGEKSHVKSPRSARLGWITAGCRTDHWLLANGTFPHGL